MYAGILEFSIDPKNIIVGPEDEGFPLLIRSVDRIVDKTGLYFQARNTRLILTNALNGCILMVG